MKTIEIRCDACSADLTYTGNCVDYRLVLGSEGKATYPDAGAVTAMGTYPPIDRPHHFCDLACLDHWRARERHRANLWKGWWDKWIAERGTKHERGSSYPTPPQEITDARKIEFEAAAIEAFPMKRPAHKR